MIRRAVLWACIALAPPLAGVLAGTAGGIAHVPGPRPRDANPVVLGPGRLVAIGGGRSLYLHCEGAGSPTVILEAGAGQSSDAWLAVQGPVSVATRTCAYDRAGQGSSLPLPGRPTAAADLGDLQRLLGAAGLAPPYVVVGQGYGARLARDFARAHPMATALALAPDGQPALVIARVLAAIRRARAA